MFFNFPATRIDRKLKWMNQNVANAIGDWRKVQDCSKCLWFPRARITTKNISLYFLLFPLISFHILSLPFFSFPFVCFHLLSFWLFLVWFLNKEMVFLFKKTKNNRQPMFFGCLCWFIGERTHICYLFVFNKTSHLQKQFL